MALSLAIPWRHLLSSICRCFCVCCFCVASTPAPKWISWKARCSPSSSLFSSSDSRYLCLSSIASRCLSSSSLISSCSSCCNCSSSLLSSISSRARIASSCCFFCCSLIKSSCDICSTLVCSLSRMLALVCL